jgi:hypothetical protein
MRSTGLPRRARARERWNEYGIRRKPASAMKTTTAHVMIRLLDVILVSGRTAGVEDRASMAPVVNRCVAAIQRDEPLAPNLPRIVMQRLSQTGTDFSRPHSAQVDADVRIVAAGRTLHKSHNRRYRQSAATNFLRWQNSFVSAGPHLRWKSGHNTDCRTDPTCDSGWKWICLMES